MDAKKRALITKLEHTYCRIKQSQIDGVGVVAIRDIPKGADPFFGVRDPDSRTFTKDELSLLHPEIKKMIDDFLVVNRDGTIDIPVDGLNSLDISFYLNTSDTPNVVAVAEGTAFATLRDIKKGEELTVAYDTYDYRDKLYDTEKN